MLQNQEKYADDQEIFALMIEELDRANTIISEFLSLAKNKPVKKALHNLNSIVISLFPLIQANAMAQDKNIKLRMQDVPDFWVDDKEVRQVLLNLVSNGLEAMAPGGRLTIRTYTEEHYVVLSVQDQGRGIDPDVLPMLGTPFFTTKEDGTGLGLAVCYGIAARNNARIEVESNQTGTTFWVKFPRETADDYKLPN